jgi:endonuclease/exonuclease/phosphatase family metal-dependent hydrolase
MKIRMGTLNAWALPEPLARDVPERMRAIGAKLSSLDLDVMAFQEVWTAEARRSLRRAGRRAGLDYCWDGERGSGSLGGGSGGLLVLSRLPIMDADFESYALRGEAEKVVVNGEYLSGKGFAMLRLRTPEGPLVILNTHLHARYASRSPHKHVAHRTGQIIQLAARHSQIREPMVLVGDFNFREKEPDYRVLTGILGLGDVAARLDQRQATTLGQNPYRSGMGLDRRKDYVFARDGANQGIEPRNIQRVFDEPLEIDGRRAAYSNHSGLIVELEMGGVAVSAMQPEDGSVFERASEILARGKKFAKRRRRDGRTLSGMGVGFGAVAGLGMIPKPISRRKMLRMSLGTFSLLALTPGVGLSFLSEVFVQDEIRAFKTAERQLAELVDARLA